MDGPETRIAVAEREIRALRSEVRETAERIDRSVRDVSDRLARVSDKVSEMAQKDEIAAAVMAAAKRERSQLLGWPVKIAASALTIASLVSVCIQIAVNF